MLNDNDEQTKTLVVTNPDILDILIIDNSDNNVVEKETETINEDNISLTARFAHGKNHKKVVIRSKICCVDRK